MTPYGSSLPTISSHRRNGVTFNCSSVPSSFSRTTAIAARFAVTSSSTSANTPGIMKNRLSSCGLNHTRMRASIPPPLIGAPCMPAVVRSCA
jgi:hypothetical protein